MFAHAVLINGFAPFVLYVDVLIRLLASMPNSAILYSTVYGELVFYGEVWVRIVHFGVWKFLMHFLHFKRVF